MNCESQNFPPASLLLFLFSLDCATATEISQQTKQPIRSGERDKSDGQYQWCKFGVLSLQMLESKLYIFLVRMLFLGSFPIACQLLTQWILGKVATFDSESIQNNSCDELNCVQNKSKSLISFQSLLSCTTQWQFPFKSYNVSHYHNNPHNFSKAQLQLLF